MKVAIALVFMGIFSFLFGCSGAKDKDSSKFPQDNYSIEQGETDDQLVFATINKGYKNYKHKQEFPWCLQIEIKIHNPTEQGLTTREEADVLNNLEDDIQQKLEKVSTVHFIKRTTWNGYRDLMFYLDKPEQANNVLQSLTNNSKPIREFEYTMAEDPKWEKAANYLK